jgi:hypothetical protein
VWRLPFQQTFDKTFHTGFSLKTFHQRLLIKDFLSKETHRMKPVLPATLCALATLLIANLFAAKAFANSADLALSNTSVETTYRANIANGVSAAGSWLHHENGIDVASVGIYGGGRQGAAGAFIGAKAFWLNADGPDGQGIAIGGALSYELFPRVTIEGNAHYAPSVTSYKDIDHYTEWGARLTLQLLPSANIFAGFRDINVDVNDGPHGHTSQVDVTRGGYAGFTLYF